MTPAPPTTPAEIAEYLDALAIRMIECGTAMDYYGGIGPMGEHGREMIGAARIAQGWAAGIRQELHKQEQS